MRGIEVLLPVLAGLALALSFTPEQDSRVSDLGDAAPDAPAPAVGAAAAGAAAGSGAVAGVATGGDGPESELLTPWDKQGLSVIKAYADYNTKLQDKEESLRKKLANPPETVKGITYQAIPGYKYTFLGRTMDQKSRSECELVCSSYSACKSYSYDADKRTCVWSMAAIRYRPGSNLFVKKVSPEGKPEQLYNEMPGMYIQDRVEPVGRSGSYLDDAVISQETKDAVKKETISQQECKYECTTNPECKTFTYTAETKECLMSSVMMHYQAEWTYYEKDQALDGESMQASHSRENDEKEELKARWIAGSSAKARQAAEKADKVTKQLKNIDKKVGAVRVEAKAALKAANSDKSQCGLAKSAVSASDKRNAMLTSELDKITTDFNDQKRKNEKAKIDMEGGTTFEARSKAEMKVSVTDPSELNTKVSKLTTDEESEKHSLAIANEKEVKACGAYALTNAVLKQKEGAQKSIEAKEKHLLTGEDVIAANKAQLKTKEAVLQAESEERRAKMSVSLKKTNVESGEKRSAAADDEMAKKTALNDISSFKEKLRKSEVQGEEANHQVMLARENLDKSNEKIKKKEEKDSKAENTVKSRKRETDMKVESVRVRKKMKLRMESDNKAEATSKQLKKEELITKKSQEQMNKGRASLDEMTAAESQKKLKLTKDEKLYKTVQKQKQEELKHEVMAKKHVEDLTNDEKDKKYKKRADALRKRTLSENEQDSKNNVREATQDAKDAKDKADTDEQKEKASASALKKATTEADTKKLMRNELNWKSVSTASTEKATKADQQKMLASEDLVQAQAKQQAETCVHVCIEGMEERKAAAEKAAASAVAPAATTTDHPAARRLLQVPGRQRMRGGRLLEDRDIGEYAGKESFLGDTAGGDTAGGDTAGGDTGTDPAPVQTDLDIAAQQAEAVTAQESADEEGASVPQPVVLPKIEPFTYNGCQC